MRRNTSHGTPFIRRHVRGVTRYLGRPKPASLARMIAWARSATWSLEKMLETWLRMVLGLSPRRWAISGLVWCWAMSSRISCSRSVSSGNSWANIEGHEWLKYWVRRQALAGPKMA